MDVSAIPQHDMERGGVIFVDPKLNFLFRDNAFGDFQGEPEALFSISFAPAFLLNKVPDMPRAIPQGFTKAMADAELPDDFIVLP